jgi:hypothetical protein
MVVSDEPKLDLIWITYPNGINSPLKCLRAVVVDMMDEEQAKGMVEHGLAETAHYQLASRV